MKYLLKTFGFAFLLAVPAFAAEDSLLARITVYWPGEGQLRAFSNGARLRAGHCAVDPKRIPFGSRVLFPDEACIAVDSGPDVVSRKAARAAGHTLLQRSAVVIDRFFESKEAAMNWANSHPQFMTVRILRPGAQSELKEDAAQPSKSQRDMAALPETKSVVTVDANGTALSQPNDSILQPARRRTL